MNYEESAKIGELVNEANKILIIQADNPDGDSLGSALALEQILDTLGKEPILYCGVDIPSYLHHMPGWDRVEKDIKGNFDLSIIVDTSSISLLNSLIKHNYLKKVSFKPCIVLDHHDVDEILSFATIVCNKKVVATGEVIYELAKDLNWELNQTANERIAGSILSDSLGLTTEATTARSIHIIGNLVEAGVSITSLDDARRALMRKSPELVKYKGELLERLEYFDNNRIVIISIPWEEIEKYSHSYNPSMLVIDDMRLVEGADIAIAFKTYNDNKMTAKIRCNYGSPIAGKLAEHFGGGGHKYASGFKIESSSNKTYEEVKFECIEVTTKLLNELHDDEIKNL
jgi:phosphoesterase RecJ-like protein